MHTTTHNRPVSTTCTAAFAPLRERLAREVSSSAMLADLLDKLNQMQEACARPADFKICFDVFVIRAADHADIIQTFLPELIRFLPKDAQQKASFEYRLAEGREETDLTWDVA
ncbi:MAG: hypothetical protein WAK33_08055 [Silvibacterium sp.]